MVLPLGAAAQAAGAAGSAGATAMGLKMGKTDLDLTRDLFKLQMRQAKRLWTADWAEASVRHGEQCMQSAQQHAEAQAMAMAAYFQAERLTSQGLKLSRDQDSRAYEMAWRAEVRESLRDELNNQYNRYNIVMLCDTVCLGCVFSLVAEGSLPDGTPALMLNLYVGTMGLSITLFSISLWFAVIVVRRLHEHTAATLERKLFVQSHDLQKAWQHQLARDLPTGPNEIYLVNQAYEKWVAQHLDPIGAPSIHMMAIGVVTMFVTAGLLTHNRYLMEYNSFTAVSIFWSTVLVTSTTVLYMKYAEDRREKKKQGVYDNSWQDQSNRDTNPYAKISRAADELFHDKAVELASTKRMQALDHQEQQQRHLCTQTDALYQRVQSLRRGALQRSKIRKNVLQLLTTAAEELDALPEDLTAQLNKLLYDIDQADAQTANLVTIQNQSTTTSSNNPLDLEGSSRKGWSRLPVPVRPPMAPYPTDAQRLPLKSLAALRQKLGEFTLSTLLRIQNLSNEPLRLKSGFQLKEGKYLKSLAVTDPASSTNVSYHLYPSTEIPPRSEIVVAAKNCGGILRTSMGIDGEIVYANVQETWLFRIQFTNPLVLRKMRTCRVRATHVGERAKSDNASNIHENTTDTETNKEALPTKDGNDQDDDDGDDDDQFWSIQKEELDIKANNEIAITIDVLQGDEGRKAAQDHRQSQTILKSGFLLKNRASGLGLQWQQRWVVLTPTELCYSETPDNKPDKATSKIAIKDIIDVRRQKTNNSNSVMGKKGSNNSNSNVFEIHTRLRDSTSYKFWATSPAECDNWIQSIRNLLVMGGLNNMSPSVLLDASNALSIREGGSSAESTVQSVFEDGFECVESELGTSVVQQHD